MKFIKDSHKVFLKKILAAQKEFAKGLRARRVGRLPAAEAAEPREDEGGPGELRLGAER